MLNGCHWEAGDFIRGNGLQKKISLKVVSSNTIMAQIYTSIWVITDKTFKSRDPEIAKFR